MGSKKRTVRKRWTLKQTVKDLSLSNAPGKERPYLKCRLTIHRFIA